MKKLFRVPLIVSFDTDKELSLEAVKDYLGEVIIIDIDTEGGESVDDDGETMANGIRINWGNVEEVA